MDEEGASRSLPSRRRQDVGAPALHIGARSTGRLAHRGALVPCNRRTQWSHLSTQALFCLMQPSMSYWIASNLSKCAHRIEMACKRSDTMTEQSGQFDLNFTSSSLQETNGFCRSWAHAHVIWEDAAAARRYLESRYLDASLDSFPRATNMDPLCVQICDS